MHDFGLNKPFSLYVHCTYAVRTVSENCTGRVRTLYVHLQNPQPYAVRTYFSVIFFRIFLFLEEIVMKRIEIRGDDEFCLMLEQLEANEIKDAISEQRDPMNRTQIIKRAVKEYYAAHANGESQNVFLDMLKAELDLILNDFFAKQYAVMNANTEEVTERLDNQEIKFSLFWRMFLNQNKWGNCTDPERLRRYLTTHSLFEDVLNDVAEEEKKGGNL